MLNYTDITQNTYAQSWTVSEIMASEVRNFDSCYTLTDYQIHIKTCFQKSVYKYRLLETCGYLLLFYPLNFTHSFATPSVPLLIVNTVWIPTCSQHLLTWFIRRPDDGHVRTETCSLTHNKAWRVWRKLFYYFGIELLTYLDVIKQMRQVNILSHSGVPRIFFLGGGFNKFSWGQMTERTGIWGR